MHPIATLFYIAIIIFLIWFFFGNFNNKETIVTPNPAKDYNEAMQRLGEINKYEAANNVRPECNSFAKTKGKKTEKVVVIFHGYTNCPIQFAEIANQMNEKGYNVLVTRIPHHGEKDRANNTLKKLTAKELAKYANDSVDIARGLGNSITVMGLSVGADLTNWVAQTRDDVENSFNMAPFYAPYGIPGFLIKPGVRILSILPPINIWWDNKTKENNVTGSPYAYAGFDTRSMSEFLKFSNFWEQALKNPKKFSQMLVLNRNDKSINSNYALSLDKNGSKKNDTLFNVFWFSQDKKLNHDIIDPYNPEQNTKYVYPIIINLLELQNSVK